jgi:CRISPR-associated Csx14 family protein
MENILIASLGESPVVVTAMYDLLTEREKFRINKIVVLHPEGELIPYAFDLIQGALKNRCEVVPQLLPFEDADSEETSYTFLHILYSLLDNAQKSGDTVYLSLAGGRKNMSALMAILVPLFSCVKKLYHLIDKDEASHQYHFKSIEELDELSEDDRQIFFFPERDHMKLVDIPYGERQQVSQAFRAHIHTIQDEEDLDHFYEMEMIEFVQGVADNQGPERILEVLLTEHAAKQFEKMWKYDRTHARGFKLCLERMRFATRARRGAHDIYSRILGKGEHDIYSQNLSVLTFHFFKIKRKHFTPSERPVFHTVPKDIKSASNRDIDRVIVSELEFKRKNTYRSLEEITNASHFLPLGPFIQADELLTSLSMQKTEDDDTDEIANTIDSVLLVPLGNTPMIATQLYTLLTYLGHTIREVVLVYPAASLEIQISAKLAQDAFESKDITCRKVPVPSYTDIDSRKACEDYQQVLEKTIDEVHNHHPNCQIELALSGGRKGMAALAMFVAQRKGIRYLYHTLINDKQLRDKVYRETEISALRGTQVSKQVRNDRLFLCAYEQEVPYKKFVLFKVPVLPAKG